MMYDVALQKSSEMTNNYRFLLFLLHFRLSLLLIYSHIVKTVSKFPMKNIYFLDLNRQRVKLHRLVYRSMFIMVVS